MELELEKEEDDGDDDNVERKRGGEREENRHEYSGEVRRSKVPLRAFERATDFATLLNFVDRRNRCRFLVASNRVVLCAFHTFLRDLRFLFCLRLRLRFVDEQRHSWTFSSVGLLFSCFLVLAAR